MSEVAKKEIVREKQEVVFDMATILATIPHRYPFLLIDKVVEFVDGKSLVAIKNVTMNEQFFQGHFPGKPVMPGVLILEAMAQAGAMLAYKSTGGVEASKTIFLVGATDVKWRRQVVPGDTLRIDMTLIKRKRPMLVMVSDVTVDGVMVASATISAAEGN